MDNVIVVADLGHFKAYGLTKEPMESPKLELLKSYDAIAANGKLSEKLSDGAGSFGEKVGKGGAKGYGEAHNLGLEIQKRLIKQIAENIGDIIKKGKCKRWHLAAAGTINKQIIANLEPDVKTKLDKNVLSDLTKVKKSKLLEYF